MIDKIFNTKYEKLLFIDIETTSGYKTLDPKSDVYGPWSWKMRDKNDLVPTQQESIALYEKKAALYPIYGKIVCIVLGIVIGDSIRLITLVGDEKDILTRFVETVNKSPRILCGHNIIAFDCPYIRKRCVKHGVAYITAKQGNDVDTKPWVLSEVIFDTMTLFKGTAYMSDSLEELALHHNLPTPKDDIRGSEVSKVFWEEGVKRIATYCGKDVITTINIFRNWKGDEPLTKFTEAKQEVKTPLMERIFAAGVVTDALRKELAVGVKALTGPERNALLISLKAAVGGGKLDQETMKLFN